MNKNNNQQNQTKEYKSLISESFPPTCPICGSLLHWESDFMLSEAGYIQSEYEMSEEELEQNTDENGILINDRVVHSFICPDCGSSAEYEDMEDNGKLILLSTCKGVMNDDYDEEECPVEYSQYACDTYGMAEQQYCGCSMAKLLDK